MQQDKKEDLSERADQRRLALSRWDNEGGAEPGSAQDASTGNQVRAEAGELSNTELTHLKVRLIALENLVIALLAGSSEYQLQLARDMVAYIEPRPGYTPHPMTLHAAAQMTHLVGRASHFQET
ncbi:MAG: hypothetical protein H7327_08750 [Herminiimonas sp.]|nr:hypothetical protein [Herminiimonas sp.]